MSYIETNTTVILSVYYRANTQDKLIIFALHNPSGDAIGL